MQPSNRTWCRFASIVIASSLFQASGYSAHKLSFLGVDIRDPEALQADEKLTVYLREKADIQFSPSPKSQYREAVYALARWKWAGKDAQPVLARVTPGVYISARMLGADIEVLGTYVSNATARTTYNSYFVVRDAEFSGTTLDQFREFLKRKDRVPPTFIYHEKFSTSSYLLPTLYFRRNDIYAVPAYLPSGEEVVPIPSRDLRDGSSSLLARLVNHTASADDLKTLREPFDTTQSSFCAVWDSTVKHAKDPAYAGLNFIKLPQNLPNDLLVISSWADAETKAAVRKAIQDMPPGLINCGDFSHWVDYNSTEALLARQALADLEIALQRERAAVTVDISADPATPPTNIQLEAIRNAVRLSDPEFVLYNRDAFKMADLTWVVSRSHDDSLVIRSRYGDIEETRDEYFISFNSRDPLALTTDVLRVINRRLPRVRTVWLHDDRTPRILRDLLLELKPGQRLAAERIEWRNRAKHDYVIARQFTTELKDSDLYSYILDANDGFAKSANGLDFDPMGNIDYRVYLKPAEPPRPVWYISSAFAFVCFIGACFVPVVSLVRGGKARS
jgi:ABC-type phosphate/phosphonate transport system substrate-binding protein